MTRYRSVLFLIGLVPAVLSAPGCSPRGGDAAEAFQEPPALEVEVAAVGRQPVTETIRLNGSLIPYRFANLTAEVDGVIRNIPDGEKIRYHAAGQSVEQGVTLDIGHRVEKDAVLVELDPTDHQLAMKAAEAKLDLAANELAKLKIWRRDEERRQIKAQLEEATAQHEKCQADHARAENLYAQRTISKEEYDRTSLACSVARALMERAQAAWDIAERGPTKEELAMAQAQVDLAGSEVKLRQENLRKCTIKAPYAGVVAERYVGVGDRVTALPRVEIMQIVDPDILFAQVAVAARYQGRIRVGDATKVRVRGVTDRGRAAGEDFVPGVVGLVNGKIDPETRTFRVRVGIDNRQGLFKPGTFAQVELTVASVPEAVSVPAAALTFSEGQPGVFVLDGQRVKRRPVRLGLSSRNEADPSSDAFEVLSGLAAGERVVVGSATPMLADGMAVQPKVVRAEARP